MMKCTCILCSHIRLDRGMGSYEDMMRINRFRDALRLKNVGLERVLKLIGDGSFGSVGTSILPFFNSVLEVPADLCSHLDGWTTAEELNEELFSRQQSNGKDSKRG